MEAARGRAQNLEESTFSSTKPVSQHPLLKARRKDVPPELIQIADRYQKRLYKKSYRLLMGGKHPNKVKVACAREMVGFIWESLRAVS